MKQRGFAHIALLALLVAGLIAGVILAQRAQVFKSKASQERAEDIIIFRGNTFCDKNGKNCEAFRDKINVLVSAPYFAGPSTASPTATTAPSPTPVSYLPTDNDGQAKACGDRDTGERWGECDGSLEFEVICTDGQKVKTESQWEDSVACGGNTPRILGVATDSGSAFQYRLWVTTGPEAIIGSGEWKQYSVPVLVKDVQLSSSAQVVYVSVQFKYRDQNGREKESDVYQRRIIYKPSSLIIPTATSTPTLTPTAAPPTPTTAVSPRSGLFKPTGLAKKCSSGGLVQLSWKPVAGFPNYWYKFWAKYTDDGKKAGEPAGRGNFASMTNFVYVKVGLDKEYSWKVMVGGANINERTGDMSTDAAESTFICHLRPD